MNQVFKNQLNEEINNIHKETVLVSVTLESTSYDSSTAWCYDDVLDIAKFINIADIEETVERWFKHYDESGMDFSDPNRIKTEYDYGHRIRIKEHNLETCRRELQEHKLHLQEIQQILKRLNNVVTTYNYLQNI